MAYTTSPSCMHMAPLLQALISIGLLLASMSILVPGGSTEEGWSGMELIHDANGGFTREEHIDHSVERTHLRAEMLSGTHGDGTGAAPVDNPYQFLVNLSIGMPPVPFMAVPDTGSDLVWTEVKLCRSSTLSLMTCSESDSEQDAKKDEEKKCGTGTDTRTCQNGLCWFDRAFGSGMKTARGLLGNETLTLSRRKNTDAGTTDEINTYNVSIGCATVTKQKAGRLLPKSADGIVGLNRQPMSLVQQLSLANFSYCFSAQLEPQVSGRLWLGDGYSFDQLRATRTPDESRLQKTQLVDVEWTEALRKTVWPYKYYIQLEGISIGEKNKYQPLPKGSFNLKSKNHKDYGVMMVDSGCKHTKLEPGVFQQLKELLVKELGVEEIKPENLPENLKESTCFSTSGEQPKMVLHFQGAEMHLPWANYTKQEIQESKTLYCLTIRENKGDFEWSILGNFQQQDTYMLYNLTKGDESLSFLQNFDCHGS